MQWFTLNSWDDSMSSHERALYLSIKRVQWTLCLLAICFLSCKKSEPYSFFVAGHVYGKPSPKSIGVHPPFVEKFGLIKSTPDMSFGILTGDMVFMDSDKHWDSLHTDLKPLNIPIHKVPGNHELVRKRKEYESRFGKTYSAFVQNGDLFILLDPLLDKWSITGEQLKFLKSTLLKNEALNGNIFVFFHQLLWWSPENKFKNVQPNWIGYRGDSCNFESDILPLFKNTEQPVYMFAGDVGAYPNKNSFFYHKEKTVTLIASGMGGEKKDNFLIIKVNESKEVEIKMVALNGDDINGLGKIEDYELPKD